MIGLFRFALAVLASPFKLKLRLEAENAVLRHQLIVLRLRLFGRVRLTNHDRMHPFLARFSEPVWSGHLASWADFITITPELEFSVHTAEGSENSTAASVGPVAARNNALKCA